MELERLDHRVGIADAEETARLVGDIYLIGRAAVRAVARLVKPANDGGGAAPSAA
jgi:hypothetical protein